MHGGKIFRGGESFRDEPLTILVRTDSDDGGPGSADSTGHLVRVFCIEQRCQRSDRVGGIQHAWLEPLLERKPFRATSVVLLFPFHVSDDRCRISSPGASAYLSARPSWCSVSGLYRHGCYAGRGCQVVTSESWYARHAAIRPKDLPGEKPIDHDSADISAVESVYGCTPPRRLSPNAT